MCLKDRWWTFSVKGFTHFFQNFSIDGSKLKLTFLPNLCTQHQVDTALEGSRHKIINKHISLHL